MSLHPQDPPSVPEETRRVARAAFPKGTLCLDIADALGAIYQDSQFTALFRRSGTDAGAARAGHGPAIPGGLVRPSGRRCRARPHRLEVGLALTGFDHTVLSEFRSRLVERKAERQLLDTLLACLRGLVKRADASARIRPTCSPRCAPSTGSSGLARRCGRR